MTYDLVIKGGNIIDPAAGIFDEKDLAVQNGKIVSVGSVGGSARRVIDARGLIVTPGMIDLHTHVARSVTRLGVDPDKYGLTRGCTTMVDAGSTGELLFPPFRKFVIQTSKVRVLAFLNIESLGMIDYIDKRPSNSDQGWSGLLTMDDESFSELFVNVRNTVRVIKSFSGDIVGIKWAHHGLGLLRVARKVADRLNVTIMAENHYEPDIQKLLRKGDVVTHIYQFTRNPRLGTYDGISKDSVHIIPEIFEAKRRGVVLDVGHGMMSFSWKLAESAFKEGLLPDTISSDLWVGNAKGPVFDLPTTLSKFIHLGMSLEDVVCAATEKPARVLGKLGEFGTLKEGSIADVSIHRLRIGRFPLADCYGEIRPVEKMLTPTHVIRKGSIMDLAS